MALFGAPLGLIGARKPALFSDVSFFASLAGSLHAGDSVLS